MNAEDLLHRLGDMRAEKMGRNNLPKNAVGRIRAAYQAGVGSKTIPSELTRWLSNAVSRLYVAQLSGGLQAARGAAADQTEALPTFESWSTIRLELSPKSMNRPRSVEDSFFLRKEPDAKFRRLDPQPRLSPDAETGNLVVELDPESYLGDEAGTYSLAVLLMPREVVSFSSSPLPQELPAELVHRAGEDVDGEAFLVLRFDYNPMEDDFN